MIDLSTWNLTLPIQTPALTVATAQVRTYNTPYFQVGADRIVMWAPVTGSHSGSSDFPRTELRETTGDGKARNWLYNSGTNTMVGALSVNQVPSAGRVVVAQIHAKDAVAPLLKMVYRYTGKAGFIDLEYRVKPADAKSPVIYTVPMALNQSFSYQIQMAQSGKLNVLINGVGVQATLDPAWYGYNFYFKAGVYTLDNVGYANEGGKVTYTKLQTTHLPASK
ncbi:MULTISPECIES: polysaccharide lyase family 7 protein [unclassified Pseudomonas]|uniref:polysaccharide lyase family 7 protein n=1 Tax=unclassified Pseudomonas TaxID=196821 RepID=UPI000BD70F7C|nr:MULTISPECIES: polysaccharide lyase family 7 protein [unclassified Pseudomonas]PVZ16058.1 alginate lyase [Pseudomonas sp. URIL14HWK12:I12]PVZ26086.1 alginate lyase [Pseudomonas sp. URIL14HWK12:I10]PVZ36390.1 alginate lyase [Pseudomonas sp. URIL14HWK12:I11]SNZ18452.1 Alginate lyase [Pseudomonas sp. URIL14HWK12:I9]